MDKDVIRTDRSHDYYKGDDNLNVKVLKEILLTYATQNPDLGYTQVSHSSQTATLNTKHARDCYIRKYHPFQGLLHPQISPVAIIVPIL